MYQLKMSFKKYIQIQLAEPALQTQPLLFIQFGIYCQKTVQIFGPKTRHMVMYGQTMGHMGFFYGETNISLKIKNDSKQPTCMYQLRCHKSFSLAAHLKTHTLSDIGQKMFACNQCNKTFSVAGSLKKHNLSHTGEIMFPATSVAKLSLWQVTLKHTSSLIQERCLPATSVTKISHTQLTSRDTSSLIQERRRLPATRQPEETHTLPYRREDVCLQPV